LGGKLELTDLKYKIFYHGEVVKDIKNISHKDKEYIKKTIEIKLLEHPEYYAVPLKRNLKGYWKLRAGDYRIVFKINEQEIYIFGIMHRKEVYQKIVLRRFDFLMGMGN
jgi:mRNA interferase RelE/StbE